jgi:colicin import membrane protein
MYYAHAYTTPRERVISGAFASTLHLLFIALLVFGVNWQRKVEPPVNIVDLWSPQSTETKAVLPPPPPEPKPEVKPAVQPKVEPTPPKPVAKPEVAKPDIAMKEKEKEKIEKERRAAEEKQKDARKREAQAKAAQKAQQAEAQRLANEQAEAQRAVAAQAAAARASLIAKYINGIRDAIKKNISRPPNLKGTEESEFDIVVLPNGNVLSVKLKKPSGNPAYDSAVEHAIGRAQPLPMPPDPALLKDFRELNLTFKAQE